MLNFLGKLPAWVYLAAALGGLLFYTIKQREQAAIAKYKLEQQALHSDSIMQERIALRNALREADNERARRKAREDSIFTDAERTARSMGLGVDSLISELRSHSPESLKPLVVGLQNKVSKERAALQAALASRSRTILGLERSLHIRDELIAKQEQEIASLRAERAIAEDIAPSRLDGLVGSLAVPGAATVAAYGVTGNWAEAALVGGVTYLAERVF